MDTTYFWYKFDILRRKEIKTFLFITLVLLAKTSFAQDGSIKHLQNYDDRPMHYGFSLGLNYSKYRLVHSDYFLQQDTIKSLRPIGGAGFNLGFIFNFRLGQYTDLRILPTVFFYNKSLKYKFGKFEEKFLNFEKTQLAFPLLIKYKSQRRGNGRMYMIGGIRPELGVGGKKKSKQNGVLFNIDGSDLALEYGFGFDIYYPLFKLSPEIRFSLGLKNLFNPENNIYSSSIKSLSTYTVTMYLLLE